MKEIYVLCGAAFKLYIKSLNNEEKNEGECVLSKSSLTNSSSCHNMVLESPAVKVVRIGPIDNHVYIVLLSLCIINFLCNKHQKYQRE